jgi:hypothetical protein
MTPRELIRRRSRRRAFDRQWRQLAGRGVCDAYGSTQYERLVTKYLDTRGLTAAAPWIRQHANPPPRTQDGGPA